MDVHDVNTKFRRLGWKRLTICLIVEAIALGSLSIPSVFATIGLVPGIIVSIGIGFIAIYTSHVIGQVKLKHRHIDHYADAVGLMFGKVGYEITSVMFVLLLVLIVGSHVLTGTIALVSIIKNMSICALAWTVISAIILFVVALPPTFAEFAILGYIDFGSIICAIMITIIATGVRASHADGGFSAVDWHAFPQGDVSCASAFLAVTNIVFAYSFAVCQFSFMSEMHTPEDYPKSIWALGLIEIFIYTGTGALVYVFVGSDVASPALLSAGPVISRVAFGVAVPVIFISGSINTTVVSQYIIRRTIKNPKIRDIECVKGWAIWIGLCAVVTVIAWIVAEAIPFFNALLGLISSLFISGFTFYFPALMWFILIKQGAWYERKNLGLSLLNFAIFIIGVIILVCGVYASVVDIKNGYSSGSVRGSFTCSAEAYT
ncbi:putative amino acid transporter [Pseudovirgaria hyperparasitica]|uniref:Putative amino acid transporter n=1 Tax=Pseudovirgaria hyperparasitica TaxID=470096 RepID=A0A6A6WIE1_9PEZI|nr:putative amino acid transporter [Pseudovirgaria hyperparasitica]KAF2762558.1 putative amino acid transporter [Pseudovirgaria hyperparasitica]